MGMNRSLPDRVHASTRTREGREIFVGRSMLIIAAKAAGVQALDTVFADFSDEEGLRETVAQSMARTSASELLHGKRNPLRRGACGDERDLCPGGQNGNADRRAALNPPGGAPLVKAPGTLSPISPCPRPSGT